ncbi:MAG TPA: beta-ketoacyl-ACP synthase III [Balneolaceae bacterium]|nr:beta-ketoacyl-ACP synthase III [Balneolaceae bacterium]
MPEIKRAKITAVGHFLPENRLSNSDLEKMVETNDDWIRSRTGIRERRILKDDDKASAYMGMKAAQEALDQRGLDPEEIDVIVVGTVTPDYLFPATACLIQKSIGATNAYAFDLSAACSGFLYSLTTGASFIESGRAQKVLVIGSDKMSSITDYSDRSTCILFGDGAGAVVLEVSDDDTGIIDYSHHSEGDTEKLLYQPAGGSMNPATEETVQENQHFVHQDGQPVFRKAITNMTKVITEVLDNNDLDTDDIDWLAPHQANKRIIDATSNCVGLDKSKVMINIQDYGNTTSGTIPLCLYDWKDRLEFGDNLILASFGGGLTWGAIYLKWGIK